MKTGRRLRIACGILGLAMGMATAAETVPLRLVFLPTASTLPEGRIQFEDAHRFDGVIAPEGEPDLFRHALGMTDPGNTSLSAAYGLTDRLQIGAAWESARQTVGADAKIALLNSELFVPLTLSVSGNAQVRLDAGDAKKASGGGSAVLQQPGDRWTALAAFAAQTGTLADTGRSPDYTLAWGLGALRRGDVVNFFAEAEFPLAGRRTYSGRAPHGIPLLGLGFGFPLWRGTLDIAAANATFMLAGNFLSGPPAPTPTRLMDWHLGFAYRYGFRLATPPPAP